MLNLTAYKYLYFLVKYELQGVPKVCLVIINKNRRCKSLAIDKYLFFYQKYKVRHFSTSGT